MGEHTDYNEGFVLPLAIPQRAVACVSARRDERLRMASRELGGSTPVERQAGDTTLRHDWTDYLQAASLALRDHRRAGGFDVYVASDVPLGAGLSSSAALLVALLRALRDLFGLALDDRELARLAQRAENEHVGAPVGVMDPMAASLGAERAALWIDTRSLSLERVPIPDGLDLAVIASGVVHSHASGDYRTRRAECEEAARRLQVPSLRHLEPADLVRCEGLPPVLARRVRHVVTENQRVGAAVEALRRGDGPALGRLMKASHASQRDDYDVSVPAVDHLVALAETTQGVFGARLTGGGFGGSIVVATEAGAAGRAARSIVERCNAERSRNPALAGERRAAVLVPPEGAP
jgi:galactokinase